MLERLWVLCAVAVLSVASLPGWVGAQAVERPVGSIVITGELENRVFMTFDQFKTLPLTEKSITVTFQSGSSMETHSFTGFLVFDVLNYLKPLFNPAVRNDKLRFYVSAFATDQYQAIVAYGELDPTFGNKQILLAYEQDGQSLALQGARLVVPGDIRGGRYVSLVETVRLDRAQLPQCADDPTCSAYPFQAVRRTGDIEPGDDFGGTGHSALNFSGSAGVGGDTWITAYNPTAASPTTFGTVTVNADVLIHPRNNSKGAGVMSLFNQGAGKKGMALTVMNAGANDSLVISTVDQAGKLVPVASVALGSAIQEDVWYRVVMDTVVTGGNVAVTGRVYRHATPTDPGSSLAGQVGTAVTFSGVRPAGVDATGRIGIVATAIGAVVDSSVTNFVLAP